MLDLNIRLFMDTMLDVKAVRTVIEGFNSDGMATELDENTASDMIERFTQVGAATSFVGARLSAMPAQRIVEELKLGSVTVQNVYETIKDVESRFRDECSSIGFMVLSPSQKSLMDNNANNIAGWKMESYFPEAAREYEEAAKCHALMRDTATVFHAMRMLEIGIKKIAKLVDIPDPIKPAERNWGKILGNIREAINKKFDSNQRLTNEFNKYDSLHASLDAVRGPWRNTTMHVESFYTSSDASHILNCVAKFLERLSELCEPIEALP